jgi:hypothetical protein
VTQQGIARLLAALDQSEAGRAAIVIIQGDHGSRTIDFIPGAHGPTPLQRDMAVMHSAFFAVRVPGQASASLEGRFALDALLGDLAARGFTAAPRPAQTPAQVYLMDERWIPAERVALPGFPQKFVKN